MRSASNHSRVLANATTLIIQLSLTFAAAISSLSVHSFSFLVVDDFGSE